MGPTPVDAPDDLTLFVRMAQSFPVRTLIFSFGLPLFALCQLAIAYLHDGSLPVIALLSAVVVGFSLTVTRYQMATYRRRTLTEGMEHR